MDDEAVIPDVIGQEVDEILGEDAEGVLGEEVEDVVGEDAEDGLVDDNDSVESNAGDAEPVEEDDDEIQEGAFRFYSPYHIVVRTFAKLQSAMRVIQSSSHPYRKIQAVYHLTSPSLSFIFYLLP